MRKDLGAKTWLFPMPVLILGTYDEKGVPNAMNAAWGGVYDTNKVTVSLSKHKTTENFAKTGAFTVAFATKKTVVASDYVGIVSANQVPNKVEKAGLHAVKASKVNAPIFEEYPVTLECTIDSFEDGTLIGSIVNVSVDEAFLKDGKLDLAKCEFIAFDGANGKYVALGDVVADAFKVGASLK